VAGAIPVTDAEKIKMYESLLEDIRDNYDCDNDAHRYNGHCRCCMAARALKGVDPWYGGEDEYPFEGEA
jgi:hypothetical protein